MAVVIVVAILPLIAAGAADKPSFRETPAKSRAQGAGPSNARSCPPFEPPRTKDGKPDLTGRWAGTPGGDNLEEHDYVDISSPPEESFISDRSDGKFPYQPWALARRAEHRAGLARGWPGESGQRLYADPQTFCLYTVPRAIYRGGFEILQGPGYVLMMFNFSHYSRYIPTDGRPHRLGDRVKLWMGNSRGTWEGNTLVVDVTNLNGKNWLDQVGNFVSDNVHVIERFTLAAANIIDYEVTIDDPTVFTRPGRFDFRSVEPVPRQMTGTRPRCGRTPATEGNKAPEDIRELGFKWFSGVVPPR